MIDKLRDFLQQTFALPQRGPGDGASDQEKLALAATALMVQLARVDQDEDPRELETIVDRACRVHGLDRHDARQLMSIAQTHADQATSLYEFTGYINDHLGQDDKKSLLVDVWSVAMADGHVDKYEEHMIRRIADLLHLNHREFIECRLAAEGRRSTPGQNGRK